MRVFGRLVRLVVVCSFGLMLAGCSTTKTVSVVTDDGTGKWTVGQHDYCFYKSNRIICMPQGARIIIPPEMKEKAKPGETVKIEDVLFLNGVVGEDAVMNAQSLPQVKMPNRDGFVSDWPPRRN